MRWLDSTCSTGSSRVKASLLPPSSMVALS